MEAINVDWCLVCDRATDGSAYCSTYCQNSHVGTSAPQPFHRAQPLYADSPAESLLDDDFYEGPVPVEVRFNISNTPSKHPWIGQGVSGIHAWVKDVQLQHEDECIVSVTPLSSRVSTAPPSIIIKSPSVSPRRTFRQPKLIECQQRPQPATLYMSKTHPDPPKRSTPILTPQQSLPSLSGRSVTDASLTSVTTGVSSVSLATPASGMINNQTTSPQPPSDETQRPSMLHSVTARLKAIVPSTASKSVADVRSKTITRKQPAAIVVPDTQPPLQPTKHRRAYSPPAVFAIPDHLCAPRSHYYQSSRGESSPASASASASRSADHPAYRNRGRKPSRFAAS